MLAIFFQEKTQQKICDVKLVMVIIFARFLEDIRNVWYNHVFSAIMTFKFRLSMMNIYNPIYLFNKNNAIAIKHHLGLRGADALSQKRIQFFDKLHVEGPGNWNALRLCEYPEAQT